MSSEVVRIVTCCPDTPSKFQKSVYWPLPRLHSSPLMEAIFRCPQEIVWRTQPPGGRCCACATDVKPTASTVARSPVHFMTHALWKWSPRDALTKGVFVAPSKNLTERMGDKGSPGGSMSPLPSPRDAAGSAGPVAWTGFSAESLSCRDKEVRI